MRRSIVLLNEDWQALDGFAARIRANATRGNSIGKPSWRTLLTRLARDEAAQRLLIDHYAVHHVVPRHELPQATILRPPEPVTKTLTWLSVEGDTIRVFQPEKREDFGVAVKQIGYIWQEPYWTRTVPAAAVAHRVAETAHRLVAAGFCVVPPSASIAARVISSDFEREVTRMVRVRVEGDYRGWFVIQWSRGEDFYDAAKRITASRYDKPHVIVPPEHYAEVLDFAERYQFTLSPAAQQRVHEAEAMLLSALLLDVPPEITGSAYSDETPILEATESEIDDALADDPL